MTAPLNADNPGWCSDAEAMALLGTDAAGLQAWVDNGRLLSSELSWQGDPTIRCFDRTSVVILARSLT